MNGRLMVKKKYHIEIVRSTIPGLSSMGRNTCGMVKTVLEQHFEQVGVTIANSIDDLQSLTLRRPDLIFLGVKQLPLVNGLNDTSDIKIWLGDYFDEVGLNYTGSTSDAIALDFDKPTAKRVVQDAGISTPAYFTAGHNQYLNTSQLPFNFPLFIKPRNAGGGKGIGADSVARDFTHYQQKVKTITEVFGSDALVEAYLPGREFSVAILETGHAGNVIAMPVELITARNNHGDRILGKRIKSADTEHVMAIHDEAIKHSVKELAVNVFRAIGARDYGRIDLRLDDQGTPHFIEANLMPGLGSGYFKRACWINRAVDYEHMILMIVARGLERDAVADMNYYKTNLIKSNGFPALSTPLKAA